jgi:hypothetical protein
MTKLLEDQVIVHMLWLHFVCNFCLLRQKEKVTNGKLHEEVDIFYSTS